MVQDGFSSECNNLYIKPLRTKNELDTNQLIKSVREERTFHSPKCTAIRSRSHFLER